MNKNIKYYVGLIIFCFYLSSCCSKKICLNDINQYEKERKEGVWVFRDSMTQQLIIASYENNMLDGFYRVFHSNGNIIRTGRYKKGVKVGKWKAYTNNGVISAETKYRQNGKLVSNKVYNVAW